MSRKRKMLDEPSTKKALSLKDFQDRLKDHHSFLVRNIECQYGLMDRLSTGNILSQDKIDKVNSYNGDYFKQNRLLLIFLGQLKKLDVEKFLQALRDCKQDHIANYITYNGRVEDDNRPLNDEEQAALICLKKYLWDQIRVNDILSSLVSCGCISISHAGAVRENKNDKQICSLLEILYRRSFAQVQLFIECCSKDHPHIAHVMDGKGVILATIVTIKFNGSTVNRQDLKMHLIQRSKERKLTKNMLSAILKAVESEKFGVHKCAPDIKLAGCTPDNSLRLYFYCPCMEKLNQFSEALSEWQLIIETYFNQLLQDSEFKPIKLTYMFLVDYCMCQRYLSMVESGHKSESKSIDDSKRKKDEGSSKQLQKAEQVLRACQAIGIPV